ncbi:uncharacterized protein [Watersipora subatra]|uniref:uncharacterized protein n=1 Tax=Watersipora subatra TaxID=2589382 RepID=UPI00355B3AD6
MTSSLKRRKQFIAVLLLSASVALLWYNQTRTLVDDYDTTAEQAVKLSEATNINKEKNEVPLKSLPDGLFRCKQMLAGLVFTENTPMGSTHGEITSPVTLSVVRSLSKEVIAHIKNIFNDDHNENIYFATIPAMVKSGNTIQMVQRIWLGQYEKMKTHYREKGWSLNTMFNEFQNSWQENHFYHMLMDENYNIVKPGEIMGIPTTTNVKFTYKSDGLMDPRLVMSGENMYLIFHTWLVDKNSHNDIGGRVHVWDMERHVKRRLNLHITLQRTEINWIPLDVRGQLYFTYSIDPLRVMKCNPVDGECQFVYEQDGSAQEQFQYTSDHLRGGTPWLEYSYPYYISLAHNVAATYKPYQDFAIYNANLVVINVVDWRVVYVSRNIIANSRWLKSEPVIRNHTIVAPFWYPTGIIMQSKDIIDVSCHLNDASGHVLRLSGIESILSQVIAKDKSEQTRGGPKVRVVQQYVLESTKEFYNNSWIFTGDIIGKTVEGKDILLS